MHERLKWLPRSGESGPFAVLLGRDGADNLTRATRSERSRPRRFCGGSPCAAAAPMRSATLPRHPLRPGCACGRHVRRGPFLGCPGDVACGRSLKGGAHSSILTPLTLLTRARPEPGLGGGLSGRRLGGAAVSHRTSGASAIAKSALSESITGTRTARGADRIVRTRAPTLRRSRTGALRCGFVVSWLLVAVP